MSLERNSRTLKRWIALSVFLILSGVSNAQDGEVSTLTLSFDETNGQIGQEIPFPIKITSSTKLNEPFQINLRFQPSKLEYVQLEIAEVPSLEGWTVTPELKKSPPAFDMDFVEILVEPGEGDFLPTGGELVTVLFTILETETPLEVGEEHVIELSPSIKALGGEILEMEAGPAEIRAVPAGAFACFFYMH